MLGLTLVDIFPKLKNSKTSFGSSIMVAFEDNHYSIEARYLDIIDGWQFYLYNVTKQVEKEEANRKLIGRKTPTTNISKLTKREKQVFDLVNKGFTSNKIAMKLNCSKRTVTTHRYGISKKLNSHTIVPQMEYTKV